MQLRGSVVLVTGASSGIGRATAELLADRGAVVAAIGRDVGALAAVVARTGGSCLALDLSHPASAQRAVDHVVATHGRLDAVVAAAGVGHEGPLAAMTPGRVAEVTDVDLRAPILLVVAALPVLLARGRGAVVVLTSVAGAVGVPGETVYSAAKAGLAAFAATAREELRGSGVTVGEVVPGVVDTPFFTRRGAPYARRWPRPVPPERVAAVVVRALETGAARRSVPRSLVVPATLAAAAPRAFRFLARHLDPAPAGAAVLPSHPLPTPRGGEPPGACG